MKTILPDGTETADLNAVLDEWKETFKGLLNPVNHHDVPIQPDVGNVPNPMLNSAITRQEVLGALHRAKKRKAMGVDCIPSEALNNETSVDFLHTLFKQCFESGIIPESWRRGIVTPIPKCSTADPRIPLNYRGITLCSHVYKLYCSIMNERLTGWVEDSDILCDEQNGFRSGRSCLDQLSSFTNIIDTRKKSRKQTYACFVDFSKAYDRINRSQLWTKLLNYRVDCKFLDTLRIDR